MIRKATEHDKEQVVNLFCENIKKQKSYISHGEIQMGIALDTGILAENYSLLWKEYLDAQMNEFKDTVLVSEENGTVNGFIIGEIAKDRNECFGVICDIVVDQSCRNMGVGVLLLESLISTYQSKGVTDYYLESGINNHEAHQFFEKMGFGKVSVIYRRKDT